MQKKLYAKTIIKLICFMILLGTVLYYVGQWFIPYSDDSSRQSDSFYKTEKNSVDALIVGSSSVFVGITPLELYEDFDISAYTRGNSTQAPAITYMNIKETYKYQKPKVVIMGVSSLFANYDVDENKPRLIRGTDDKKISIEKLEVAAYVASNSDEQNFIDYIFPIFRYHDRWKNITAEDVIDTLYPAHDYMRGQYTVYKSVPITARDKVDTSVEPEEYNQESWHWYKKAIDYCKKQGSEVVVVYMPTADWSYGRYITAKKLMDETGVDYLDFNLEEMITATEIDWSKDFYNDGHVNLVGAEKITQYIGQYLINNYKGINGNIADNNRMQLEEDLVLYKNDLMQFKEQIGI